MTTTKILTALATIAAIGGCGAHDPSSLPSSGSGSDTKEPAPSPGSAPGSAGTVPRARCIDPEVASNGTEPTPPRHATACAVHESDQLGPVSQVARTFGGGERVTSERFERLDDPPRTTVHDYTYVVPPRKSLRVVEYDAQGRMTREAVDDGIDAIVDTERRWTFDGFGREIVAEARTGTSAWTDSKTYDVGGFLTLEKWLVDGSPSTSTSWARRADGAPLVSDYFSSPGVLGSRTTWSYDGLGRLHQKDVDVSRSSKSPDRKKIESTTYDDAGRIVEVRSGWNEVDDSIRQVAYDAKGNVLRDHQFDTSAHEIEDRVKTYDADGRMLTDWHKWGFGFAAGADTDFETRTLGPCDEVTASSRSTNGKAVATVSSKYDDAGHLVDSEQNTFVPSPSASRSHASFDAVGHLTGVRSESRDGSGWKATSERKRVFDAAGHLVLDETVAFPSGTITREAWTFDATGDLVVYESNANFGRHAVREELDYGCLTSR